MAEPRIIAATGWATDELDAAITAAMPLGVFDLVSLLIGVNDQYRGRPVEEYRPRFAALLQRAIGFAGQRRDAYWCCRSRDWGVTPYARRRRTIPPAPPSSWMRSNRAAGEKPARCKAWPSSISPRSAAAMAPSRRCWPPTACNFRDDVWDVDAASIAGRP